MDTQNQSADKVLLALSEANKTLEAFAIELRTRLEVQSAGLCSDPLQKRLSGEFNTDGTPVFYVVGDIGVSATLTSGYTTDWYLTYEWNEKHWLLDYDVLSNNIEADGCEAIIPFPGCTGTSLDTFIQQLNVAIEELVATTNNGRVPT